MYTAKYRIVARDVGIFYVTVVGRYRLEKVEWEVVISCVSLYE